MPAMLDLMLLCSYYNLSNFVTIASSQMPDSQKSSSLPREKLIDNEEECLFIPSSQHALFSHHLFLSTFLTATAIIKTSVMPKKELGIRNKHNQPRPLPRSSYLFHS